jgi:hypothetical protein
MEEASRWKEVFPFFLLFSFFSFLLLLLHLGLCSRVERCICLFVIDFFFLPCVLFVSLLLYITHFDSPNIGFRFISFFCLLYGIEHAWTGGLLEKHTATTA